VKLSAEEWRVAREVCTPRQLQVLDLWRRGAGKKRIGLVLGIHPSTAAEHVRAGLDNVAKRLEEASAA
jgi:DNA-binding CsgD family transcriptional regulator